jgi:hypothetical protein
MYLFEYTIKLLYIKSFNYFFFYLPHKTICQKYVIKSLIHDFFYIIPTIILQPISALDCVSGWYWCLRMLPRLRWKSHVLISIYCNVCWHTMIWRFGLCLRANGVGSCFILLIRRTLSDGVSISIPHSHDITKPDLRSDVFRMKCRYLSFRSQNTYLSGLTSDLIKHQIWIWNKNTCERQLVFYSAIHEWGC